MVPVAVLAPVINKKGDNNEAKEKSVEKKLQDGSEDGKIPLRRSTRLAKKRDKW